MAGLEKCPVLQLRKAPASLWGHGSVRRLQNRFSPELGRRAAEIFSGLTGGRYGGVVLDRSFRLSAEPAGEGVYREAELLSAGALDQLYLAVRLAICDLVLPPEKTVPIVLDDALANFDDSLSEGGGPGPPDPALHLSQPGGGLFHRRR